MSNRGDDEKLICTLLRHESDEMPYEYIDVDYKDMTKFMEGLYTINENDIDTEVA